MGMKRATVITLGLLALASLALASGTRMPQILYSRVPEIEYPIWVAADAVLAPDGSVNRKFVGSWLADWLESHLDLEPVDGCIRITEAYSQPGVAPPSRATVELAAQNVAFALHGRVTGKTFGFHHIIPGQLLSIEPLEWLKGGPEGISAYYVFYPVGTFSVGDHSICKTDQRYPEPPQIGDEVLVTDPWRARKDDSFIETWGVEGIIVIQRDGTVHLPGRMSLRGEEERPMLNTKAPSDAERPTREELLEVFRSAVSKEE